ncbi:glycosyltransferase family 2 protein [Daejeonella sp.]|uniref:glycosyltransferase family 2 protein n=1 Tax=Daejeonella sp. TaxID=2805397 RepID=UPI0025C1ED31|nr:glycosyltransferase family 2 protein [Daejeonella sp.]
MINKQNIVVIIPAFNEENSVGKVIADIPKDIVNEVIVVNNNSNDLTSLNAFNAGATVVDEPNQGYGNACLKGLAYLKELKNKPDIVIFLDADYSDYPEEIAQLIAPILNQDYDMVIGSRALGNREIGSMMPQQIFGNWLATTLLNFFYKVNYTDLGPFRAIKYDKLLEIDMVDRNYGWTVEMQLKAAKLKFKTMEVPVKYRVRIGHSKVSGTIKGTIGAGYKIITTIFKYL